MKSLAVRRLHCLTWASRGVNIVRMLSIRFQRVGKKHQPNYRIVVVERRSKLGGPPVEYLGHYDPFTKKGNVASDRVAHWLRVGAHPSITVHNVLVRLGAISGPKLPVHIRRKTERGILAENSVVMKEGVVDAVGAVEIKESADIIGGKGQEETKPEADA